MKKVFLLSFLVFGLFVLSSTQASAAILVIDKNGEITWNVLSSESDLTLGIPERSSLEVKKLPGNISPSPSAVVSLTKNGDKVQLKVVSDDGEREMDVSKLQEDVIEIEEVGATNKVKILASNDQFLISQSSISAATAFPIQIDTKDRELSVQTPSGLRYLSILPYEAVENTVKANVLNRLEPDGRIQLLENDQGELEYKITGSRVLELFNIFKITVPVEASISASTGRILTVQEPTWFKIFGFLIT
jgi:hypothetical protein